MGHILIVDDDPEVRELLHIALEGEGHQVCEASGGERALELLRASERRLVVILDYLMPRVSGEAVLEAMTADPELARRHAFIVVSAGRYLPDEEKSGRAGLTLRALPKPFDLDELLELVEENERRLEAGE